MTVTTLLQLPAELLHGILSYIDPQDLATVPRACRALREFVVGNRALCRAIYLRCLDDPHAEGEDIPWEQALRDVVKLQRICAGQDPNKKSELPFVYATFTTLLRRAARGGTERLDTTNLYPPSRNADLLAALFADSELNQDAFLRRSFLYERARGLVNRFPAPPREEHQMSAKLHCLYGMPAPHHHHHHHHSSSSGGSSTAGAPRSTRSSTSRMYPFACSKVYDLRQYTDRTRWGPFRADGGMGVDWEMVEAILIVLRGNIRNKGLDGYPAFGNFWNTPFGGSWPNSYLPKPMVRITRELMPLADKDPYGVSGFWLRIVCFLDYNDFFRYNFPIFDQLPGDVPRPTLDVDGATRLILMKIEVTRLEPPGKGDGQGLPVVHFRGLARSVDGTWDENANSGIRGTCRLTPEGEVRWTSYSIFMGEERWSSEGIQLGGVRSARGIVGTWFDKDFDPHGPCGPTAFWKLSDPKPYVDGGAEGGEGGEEGDGDDEGLEEDIIDMPHRDLLPLYVATVPSDFGEGQDEDGEDDGGGSEGEDVDEDEDGEDGPGVGGGHGGMGFVFGGFAAGIGVADMDVVDGLVGGAGGGGGGGGGVGEGNDGGGQDHPVNQSGEVPG